jgi:hypothetical protein
MMDYASAGLASACFFAVSALKNCPSAYNPSLTNERGELTMNAITEGRMVANNTQPMLNAKDSMPLIGVRSPIRP